jgi:hypothetical protein
LVVNSSAWASTTISETFTVNITVPENNDTELADYRNISAAASNRMSADFTNRLP